MQAESKISNAAIGKDERILMNIRQKEINIAIWNRDIKHLQLEVKHLMQKSIKFHASGSIEDISLSLKNDLEENFEHSSQLLVDIIRQVELFERTSKASSFNLLLATVNTNMCRRFHTDMNDLRMLCTYSGPGTLWLTENNLDRDALYTPVSNDGIALNENEVQQAQLGATIILKGAIYPIEGTQAIVHRSPTIEESGQKRLLLRIDTNDFLGSLLQ